MRQTNLHSPRIKVSNPVILRLFTRQALEMYTVIIGNVNVKIERSNWIGTLTLNGLVTSLTRQRAVDSSNVLIALHVAAIWLSVVGMVPYGMLVGVEPVWRMERPPTATFFFVYFLREAVDKRN